MELAEKSGHKVSDAVQGRPEGSQGERQRVNRRSALLLLLVSAIAAIGVGSLDHASILTPHGPQQPRQRPRRRARSRRSPARAQPRPPVVFIGLDGADWALLDQYIARGVMPTLRKLVARRVERHAEDDPSGALAAHLEHDGHRRSAARASRARLPARQSRSASSASPITSDERQVPAVWNMATNAGKTRRRARASGPRIRPKRSTACSSPIACSRFSTANPNRRPASSIRTILTAGRATR